MTLEEFQNGQLILIDKPLHWTSFQVVNKVRWVIKKHFGLKNIKVGHAGTLDPLATGLLVLCTGGFTKKLQDFQGLDKTYTGTITLGKTTPSFDLETPFDTQTDTSHITEMHINEAARSFIGQLAQVPPIFSAVKVDGDRAYKKARAGQELELSPRNIAIHRFDITEINLPSFNFLLECSKGTYVRSLARDMGQVLKTGAYLAALRRTKIGPLQVTDAISPETFEQTLQNNPIG